MAADASVRPEDERAMMDAHHDDDGSAEPHVAIQRISHELRTPLTVVIGFCELLASERPDDASIKEFAARISANAWVLHIAVERLIEELHTAEYTGPPASLPEHWSARPGALHTASCRAKEPAPSSPPVSLPPDTAAPDDSLAAP